MQVQPANQVRLILKALVKALLSLQQNFIDFVDLKNFNGIGDWVDVLELKTSPITLGLNAEV